MTSVSTAPAVLGSPCPHCGSALVSERGATPWCAACGWNIDCYEPSRRQRELRWRWADKLSFEAAYDLNEGQFVALSGRPVDRPPFSVAKALILALSILGLACDIGLALFGAWLIWHDGGLVRGFVGIVLLAFAFALRPRLGKLGKYAEPVKLADLPALDRLITRIAAEMGAPKPAVLFFNSSFNAASGAYGLRRRRYIGIGLALWLSLTPQERIAMLGHELGHFVNGDVRRGPLSRYAFQLLGNLMSMTRSDYGPGGRSTGRNAGVVGLAELLVRPILALITLVFGVVQLGIEWLGTRASHHAEYAADAMAARVAGSAAMTTCLDVLMLDEACQTVVRRAARTDPSPAEWGRAASNARLALMPRMLRLRQLTMRDAAFLSHSHPPTGLRARLVESRPAQPGTVVMTEAEIGELHQEMAGLYRQFRDGARV